MSKPIVIFEPGERVIEINSAKSVLAVALSGRVELNHSCGGMGSCGTCRVIVQSPIDLLSPRTDLEIEMAEERGFRPEERLACQLRPHSGLCVSIPQAGRT